MCPTNMPNDCKNQSNVVSVAAISRTNLDLLSLIIKMFTNNINPPITDITTIFEIKDILLTSFLFLG